MEAAPTSPIEPLSFASLARAARRNFLLIFGSVVLLVVVIVFLTLRSGPEYESQCSIWVQRSRGLVETSPLEAPEPSGPLLVAFLQSRTIRLEVAEKMGLMQSKEFWGELPEEPNDAVLLARLDNMIEIYEVRSRPLIEVSVRASTPELAKDLLTNMVFAAIGKTEDLQRNEADFYSQQLEERKAKFEQAVGKMTEFQREHGLVTDVARQGQAYFEATLRLQESLLRAESERAGVSEMLNAPTDPAEQLDLLARQDGLQGSVDFLKSHYKEANQVLHDLPELARKYTMLQAEMMTQQELLKQTALKTELAKFEAAAQYPKIVLVEEPRLPSEPISELPARLLLAIVLGFSFGCGLAALREALRAG